MTPRKFLIVSVSSFALLTLAVYGFILFVDPYSNVPFSLPLERVPVSTNQRFAYPALARAERFDSAIIGSSTLRLLDPNRLSATTGARFANLAMNSATAYEQQQLLALFLRHHGDAKFIVIGIDDSWCRREKTVEKFTFRAFPQWMYDENPWNDLAYMFNDKAVENSIRLVEYFLGEREAKYDRNGFRDFTLDFGDYEATEVHQRLYPKGRAETKPGIDLTPQLGRKRAHWQFASHTLLDEMLTRMPSATRAVLVMAPMHAAYLSSSKNLYRECKGRIIALAATHKTPVLDFMIDSDITSRDENYWDPLHYRTNVAREIEASLARNFLDQAPLADFLSIYR